MTERIKTELEARTVRTPINPFFAVGSLMRMNHAARRISEIVDRHGDVVYIPGIWKLPGCVLVANAESADSLLRDKFRIKRSFAQEMMEPLVGVTITGQSSDERYLNHRSLIAEPLKHTQISLYTDIIQDETAQMLATWDEKMASGEFDLGNEIGDLMAAIVPKTLMGGAEFPPHLDKHMENLINIGFDLWTQVNPIKKKTMRNIDSKCLTK